ncbi:protein-tyrosine phosphatase family protein [Gloeomargarita lithophora]|nr:dual specificity protein phosphatase family protein [Gloeomargarita lithophora]
MRKPTPTEIPGLKSLGINALVSVMDDPSNLDLYAQNHLPHLWLPTTGGQAPTPAQIQELYEFVNTQNELSHQVIVHCSSGRRRTGTFLAAYLIQTGLGAEEAIQIIQQANPEVELRSTQITFLQELAAGVTPPKSP